MGSRLRIGINGIGRIGKILFRQILDCPGLEVVAINDINPDIANVAYQLKYDSQYGTRKEKFYTSNGEFRVNDTFIGSYCKNEIDEVPWSAHNADVVIDSSGVHHNVIKSRNVVSSGVKKVVVTHSPDEVDITLILGVNHSCYVSKEHHVISSSICDAVAAAPFLDLIDKSFGIDSGNITTLHPFLSYQNLLDGPSVSWNWPGEIYHHYALGRSSVGALIPKPTSAVDAIGCVLPKVASTLGCMSFRVPTAVVGAAIFDLELKTGITNDEINLLMQDSVAAHQPWKIFRVNKEPLVSVDFLGAEESLIYDQRWTNVVRGKKLYAVCWYDNEWGYSARVLDIAEYICA